MKPGKNLRITVYSFCFETQGQCLVAVKPSGVDLVGAAFQSLCRGSTKGMKWQ